MTDPLPPDQVPGSEASSAHPWQSLWLGGALLIGGASLAYAFLRLWPAGQTPPTFDALGLHVSAEIRTLVLVMSAGGLGSFVHAATSFADYVGNRRLSTNWFWWYALRLPIGMVLAVIIYAVIRGGMLMPGTGSEQLNNFGIVAVAFLSGMFSKQATDKLDEVFKTLFRTAPAAGDGQRKDKLSGEAPSILGLTPSPMPAGTETMTVEGSGFTKGTVISVNGRTLTPEFRSSTELVVTLPADLSVAGTLTVTAVTADRRSAPRALTVGP